MAPYLSRALCALALVAHASALALRAPVRAPLALGRRTALLRMALPASVMEFVPESVASDAGQMQQVEETWKVISRVYQSDDAALQALRQNSQILQPVYSNPELVKESYDGLLAAMGNEADALEIMKQNPAGAMPSALHRTVLCIVRCALPGVALLAWHVGAHRMLCHPYRLACRP